MHNDYPLSPKHTHTPNREQLENFNLHMIGSSHAALKSGDCTINPWGLSCRQHPVFNAQGPSEKSILQNRKVIYTLFFVLNIPDWIRCWAQYTLLRGTEGWREEPVLSSTCTNRTVSWTNRHTKTSPRSHGYTVKPKLSRFKDTYYYTFNRIGGISIRAVKCQRAKGTSASVKQNSRLEHRKSQSKTQTPVPVVSTQCSVHYSFNCGLKKANVREEFFTIKTLWHQINMADHRIYCF